MPRADFGLANTALPGTAHPTLPRYLLAMRLSHSLWRKALLLWPVALSVTVTDCATKHVAEEHLFPHLPYDVIGNVIRFTLGYNPAGAMNISFGAWSRPILVVLTGITLAVLVRWYLRTRESRHGAPWVVLSFSVVRLETCLVASFRNVVSLILST